MRIIKFRGKRVDNGEWVYGSGYVKDYFDDNEFIAIVGDPIFQHMDMIRVIYKTVGQFTGLFDKNGKEIYEGDIVNCWGGEWVFGVWEYLEIIEILDIREMFELTNVNWEGIEIIGNIHDNKEENA